MALKQTLIPNTWYKFQPYSGQPDVHWYFYYKSQSDTHYRGGNYIGKLRGEEPYFWRSATDSSFGDYTESTFVPVVGDELAWVLACELGGVIIDQYSFYNRLKEIGYNEIINQYEIY